MQQALEFALSLISARDEAPLAEWLLTTLREGWSAQGALLARVAPSGRDLNCQGWMGENAVTLTLGVDDFSHPIAFVLHKGQARTWDSLYGGARVEHAGFRSMLGGAGQHCGMFCLPLKDGEGKLLAVLALFDEAARLEQWEQDESLTLLSALFIRQLGLIRELGQSRRGESALRDSLRQLKGEGEQRRQLDLRLEQSLIGQSAQVRRLREQVSQAAGHRLSVLIQGETGSGKEVVARLLHQCSARSDKPFVAINCAAIPENLIESELFGYQKGAFSGAQNNKTGLIAQACGGTLFLDEVGDMPQAMQAKLLRVLETRSFRPLGSDREYHSDFRLVAATHQPLEQHVEEGRFRQDLYHRLCQCLLRVAPLRERPDDIPLLSQHFINQFAAQEGKSLAGMQRSFLKQLVGYDFPGNVRELKNLLEVASAHTPDGREIRLEALPATLRERVCTEHAPVEDDFYHIRDLRQAMQQYEASVIEARLRYFQGNRMLVAESLNIPKRTLDHKCQKLEVN